MSTIFFESFEKVQKSLTKRAYSSFPELSFLNIKTGLLHFGINQVIRFEWLNFNTPAILIIQDDGLLTVSYGVYWIPVFMGMTPFGVTCYLAEAGVWKKEKLRNKFSD